MKESELDKPVRLWLEGQGYKISGEVKDCDMVALKGNEMIIIEFKTRFSLDIVYQALKRKTVSDSVYIALPIILGKKTLPKFKDVKRLLRRLEVGLILVRFMKSKTRVELIAHPTPFKPIRAHRRKASIIREIEGRYGEFNIGGSTSGDLKLSAYKQQALAAAWLLNQEGELSPATIRKMGGGDKTQRILSQNLTGWFDKVRRGVYELNDAGVHALSVYDQYMGVIAKKLRPLPEQEEPQI